MKVAVSCDALVNRSYPTLVVEAILSIYEDAELYTIVHHQGEILGPVEQRKIHSTYLSNVFKSKRPFSTEWWNKSFLIPGACKNLFIPCSFDLIINISSGLSHGISKCKDTYQITYLVENQFNLREKKTFFEKIFSGFVENWSKRSLNQCNELWLPNEESEKYWKKFHPNTKLLSPFFNANDFPLFTAKIRQQMGQKFLAIDGPSLESEKLKWLITQLESEKIAYKIIGSDDHLDEVKSSINENHFLGERCAGELAPILSAAVGLISFQRFGFSQLVTSALSTGTPIWLPASSESLNYCHGPGVFNDEKFPEKVQDLIERMKEVDHQKVHGQTTKFHDLKFKSEIRRRVMKINIA